MPDNTFRGEREYFALFDIINKYDDRFIIIKGWGVTLSMAALGSGFQFGHYGLYLVASISSFAFWLVEGTIKRHQMRFYTRMREIENSSDSEDYRPRIDTSWAQAPRRHKDRLAYKVSWLLPAVMLPHIVTVLTGAVLFYLGLKGRLTVADGRLMPM